MPAETADGKVQAPWDGSSTIFEPHIDALLKIGGIESSPKARSDLLLALQFAKANWELSTERASRRRAPPKLLDQFIKTIEKGHKLLKKLRGYEVPRDLGTVIYPVGTGIIDVATAQEMIRGRMLELPHHPSISDRELYHPACPSDMMALINLEPFLRRLVFDARKGKRRRGSLKKSGKEAVVSYAERYFRRYSPKKPSTDPENPFQEFAERFYEVVTETKPDGLERQIRNVLAQRRSRQ
jgi:hypothetical protein